MCTLEGRMLWRCRGGNHTQGDGSNDALAAGRLPVEDRHAADSDTAKMDTGCWACWSNASPLQCPALQKCSASLFC